MIDKPTKILVTGAKGQLGSEIKWLSTATAYHFVFTDADELDITNPQQVQHLFAEEHFQYCINCAAYTQVDHAENNQETAYKINETGAKNLASACKSHQTVMIQISTDFVFGDGAFKPLTENTSAHPIGVYGKSKLAGERAVAQECPSHFIIRTAWLYSRFGNNFVKTMQRLGKERKELKVVADQIGTPTYACNLAEAIIHIIKYTEALNKEAKEAIYGTYHYSNEGVASWYDFAMAIMELSNIDANVLPIPTSSYPTLAQRPHYSLLDKTKIKTTFALNIPHWRKSLVECVALIDQ